MITESAREIARLQTIILDALKAMDEGLYGDARKILKTGKADALKPVTGVIARDAGQ